MARPKPAPQGNDLPPGPYAYPWVVKDEDTCDGKARLAGTRIPVWVIAFYLNHGQDDAWLKDQYPRLTAEALRSAKEYIRTHADEIAQDLAEDAEL